MPEHLVRCADLIIAAVTECEEEGREAFPSDIIGEVYRCKGELDRVEGETFEEHVQEALDVLMARGRVTLGASGRTVQMAPVDGWLDLGGWAEMLREKAPDRRHGRSESGGGGERRSSRIIHPVIRLGEEEGKDKEKAPTLFPLFTQWLEVGSATPYVVRGPLPPMPIPPAPPLERRRMLMAASQKDPGTDESSGLDGGGGGGGGGSRRGGRIGKPGRPLHGRKRGRPRGSTSAVRG